MLEREEGREGKAIFEITDGNSGDDLCVGFFVAFFCCCSNTENLLNETQKSI
jgi:hypothetical protein